VDYLLTDRKNARSVAGHYKKFQRQLSHICLFRQETGQMLADG